ncbi:VapB-type antitoxin [Candidatus Bathyarchaeota archaeon]|nr:VapB-type antitoxin [Candidatus Bathyarchaeota archaeon]
MTIVKVDERGRMTIPKELGVRDTRVVIIPTGSFFVVIPLPTKLHKYAGSWLPSKHRKKELKELAEKSAFKDAAERARRRKQL